MPSAYERARSHSERKPLASERAKDLQNSWKHGQGDTKAVVWTKPQPGQEKGVRYEGTHVSPTQDGLHLHGGPKAMKFSNESVDEVHYINPRG